MKNKYKIGVFGSAVYEDESITQKAKELGKALGKNEVVVITGACPGLPYEAALEASKGKTEIWGFSHATCKKELQAFVPNDDISIYKKVIYVPKDFSFTKNITVCQKYRNVTSTATCDAGIIISGRWGTMNEFSNLHDMGKVIGVLTGTGGIADEIQNLLKKINKPSKCRLIFDSDPANLVKKIFAELNK